MDERFPLFPQTLENSFLSHQQLKLSNFNPEVSCPFVSVPEIRLGQTLYLNELFFLATKLPSHDGYWRIAFGRVIARLAVCHHSVWVSARLAELAKADGSPRVHKIVV